MITGSTAMALEIESLRQQLETERMRLAACGVVALANTSESAAKARKMLPEYHSGSCDAVAAAVDREMALRQQLAATIAACKLKDEALQNCEGMLDELRDYPITHDAIIEALAIQPDDSALKAWLGEPIAWKHDDPKRHDAITDSVKELLQRANSEYMHRPIDKTEHYTIPLYSPKGLK